MSRPPSPVAAETARSPATTAVAFASRPSPGVSLVELGKAIANSVHRQQVSRARGIRLELVPNVLHVRVDSALVGFERHTVHGVEKLRAREDAAGLSSHRGDELELGRREIDDAVRHGRAHPRDVERDITDTDDLGFRPRTLGSAKHRAHACDELLWTEGLRDVIVRAELEAHELVRFLAPAVYYHPFFFGGFGFLFPLLFIFFIFFALRAAFWGWGGRHYGGGWGKGYYQSPRQRLEALHKELHGEKPTDTGATSPPPSGR